MHEAHFPSEEHAQGHVQTVDITNGPVDLAALHEFVVARKTRVELVRGVPGTDACVLITKSELDGLERALEILAATDDVRSMRDELARVVSQTRDPVSVFDSSGNGDRLNF